MLRCLVVRLRQRRKPSISPAVGEQSASASVHGMTNAPVSGCAPLRASGRWQVGEVPLELPGRARTPFQTHLGRLIEQAVLSSGLAPTPTTTVQQASLPSTRRTAWLRAAGRCQEPRAAARSASVAPQPRGQTCYSSDTRPKRLAVPPAPTMTCSSARTTLPSRRTALPPAACDLGLIAEPIVDPTSRRAMRRRKGHGRPRRHRRPRLAAPQKAR